MKEGDFIPLQSLMHNVALTPIFFSLPIIRDSFYGQYSVMSLQDGRIILGCKYIYILYEYG